jgi:protein-S-isoprenylcysteine O-methyltransferase Ste14
MIVAVGVPAGRGLRRDSVQGPYALVAWAGAAAFAASLGWFLYSYVFRWGDPPPPASTLPPILMNVALFSLFALHHSLFARAGLKTWIGRHVPPKLERSLYTWAASVLFAIVCTWWQPVPGVLYSVDGPLALVGYAAQLAGVALTLIAGSNMDFLDLAGVRQIHAAERGEPPAHVALQTRGLYGFVRHPLYFAWVLLVCGAPTMTATRATFAAISTAYLALAIPWEERSLVRLFGPAYEDYRRYVRWRMIPFVY